MNRNSPALVLVGRLGASGLALISAPIVARAIGPEGRGETAAAVALFSLVPVLIGLGLPMEVRRTVAVEGHAASVRTSRKLVLASLLFAVPLAWFFHATVFESFSEGARTAATTGVALTPLTLSWICDIGVLVAKRDFLGIFCLQLLQPVTYLLGIVVMWGSGLATTATVIWVYVGSNAVSFLFGLYRVGTAPKGAPRSARELAKGSVRYAGGALAESASNRLDQVLALPVMGAAQAGLYSVSVTVGLAPLAIAQALSASSFTPITAAEGRRRTRLIGDSIRQASSLSFAAAVIIFLLGPGLVVFLFGQEFLGSAPAIRVSAISCFLASIAVQASSNLIALGHPRAVAVSQVVSLAAGTAGLLVLGPKFGSLGAAIASSIGYGALAILAVRYCRASLTCTIPTPWGFVAGLRVLFGSRK